MEAKDQLKSMKRAAILASTAVIALLSACQAPAGNSNPSSTVPAAKSGNATNVGGGY
jgi:hypothetical protein